MAEVCRKREKVGTVCARERERVYGKTLKPQNRMSKEALDKWGFYSHGQDNLNYETDIALLRWVSLLGCTLGSGGSVFTELCLGQVLAKEMYYFGRY